MTIAVLARALPRAVSCCPETPSSSLSYKELPGAHSNDQQTNSHIHRNLYLPCDHVLKNDVDNNLHYKKHMLNLPAILNHEEERATNFAELWLKKRKWTAGTGTGIFCLIIAETL